MVRRDEGFFSASDNLRLFHNALIPDAPKAHVAIVHGYLEHSGRYQWVMEQLAAQGFAAHAFDYRGHGQADGRRGHCDRFSEFIGDLDRFWKRVLGVAGKQKTFLLAHSHGALMAATWARSRPEQLAGMVLSAPYLKLALKPPRLKVLGSRLISPLVPWLPVRQELKPSDLTRDPVAQAKVAKDPLYGRTVTPRWFTESTRAQLEALKAGPDIHVPVFTLCGANDPIAAPATVRLFFDTLASRDKKFREYPERVHEPLNDLGKEEVFADVSSWLTSHL